MAADQPVTSAPSQTVAANATQPQPKLYAKVYGDWIYRCAVVPGAQAKSGVAQQSCAVAQNMVLNANGHVLPLMTLAFGKAPGHLHVLNIVAPLDVLLAPGAAISVDADKPVIDPYKFCNNVGCWSVDQPADLWLDQARAGKLGHAKIILVNGRSVTINFSLSGIGPAITALDSGVPPKQLVTSATIASGPAQ